MEPFTEVKNQLSNDNSAHAYSHRLTLTKLIQLCQPKCPKCSREEKMAQLGG